MYKKKYKKRMLLLTCNINFRKANHLRFLFRSVIRTRGTEAVSHIHIKGSNLIPCLGLCFHIMLM